MIGSWLKTWLLTLLTFRGFIKVRYVQVLLRLCLLRFNQMQSLRGGSLQAVQPIVEDRQPNPLRQLGCLSRLQEELQMIRKPSLYKPSLTLIPSFPLSNRFSIDEGYTITWVSERDLMMIRHRWSGPAVPQTFRGCTCRCCCRFRWGVRWCVCRDQDWFPLKALRDLCNGFFDRWKHLGGR